MLVGGGVSVRSLASVARLPPRADVLLLADDERLQERLAAVSEAAQDRRRPLRVLVLSEPDEEVATGAADAVSEPAAPGTDCLRVERVDPYATAARILLGRWPLHRSMDPPGGQLPHVLIAGFGPFARALLLHALRVGQYGEEPPVVTLAADTAAQWREWIDARHPQAGRCAHLRFEALSAPRLDAAPPVTTMAVCDLPATAALALGRELLALAARRGDSPLLLLAADAQWPAGAVDDWDGQTVPVQPLRLSFSRAVLLEGRDDVLAEVIHEHYRDTSAAQGRDPAAAPSGRPWPELAASYRDANRHQADHLWAKLAVTDCRAVPEELVESFAFTPTEVERLAIIEHRRWAVERWLDGWTYGPQRDNARKLHPQLIPYAALSDAMQDLDRFAVRLVPALLARSGLGVVRRLVVGVWGGALRRSEPVLRRGVHRVLGELAARFPDRGLTLALDLTDRRARSVATEAIAHHPVGLFVLLSEPLPALLAAEPPSARNGILRLLAKAERRVQLAGEAEVADWLGLRAEILFALDDQLVAQAAPDQLPTKRVNLDARGDASWNFAY
ncbi:MAG: RyR domain-containing protein [Thiohalocapsa sp.]|jgi:hypothetical protein